MRGPTIAVDRHQKPRWSRSVPVESEIVTNAEGARGAGYLPLPVYSSNKVHVGALFEIVDLLRIPTEQRKNAVHELHLALNFTIVVRQRSGGTLDNLPHFKRI